MEYLQAADEGTLFWFESHHQPWLTPLMKAFTFLGDKWAMVAIVAAAGLVFALAGRRRTAAIVLAGSLFGLGVSQACKYIIKRERPDVAWKQVERPHSPSFPSGHSLNSMAIFGTIALTISRALRRWTVRGLIIGLALGLSVVIGISRPYLGVHYPSDVLAGWTAGLACALLAFWVDQHWGDAPRRTPLVLPSLAPQGASLDGESPFRAATEERYSANPTRTDGP